MEIQGTFNAQRFFDTLALIISQRENVKVTVKVTQKPEKEKKNSSQRKCWAHQGFFKVNVNSSTAVQINNTRYKEEYQK